MTHETSHHDVVIVGGRAAGAATAMLLAREGLDVVVLERGTYGSDTLSTHALMRAGVLQLHRWGVLDKVREAGTPPIRRVDFLYEDEEISVPIRPSGGLDALYAPRRTVLDPTLVDAAVQAGADVRFRTVVDGLLREPGGRVTGVAARCRSGRTYELRAGLVVGADGVRSLVAREARAATTRYGTAATANIYGYFPIDGKESYRWAYRQGATAGSIATNEGTLVFAGTMADRFRAESASGLDACFRRYLREASPQLADEIEGKEPLAHLRGYPGIPGYMRRPWGRGWALVGDAGYFKDPLSAHGITDALRDAELLARAVLRFNCGAAPLEDCLAVYERTRDNLSIPLFDLVDQVASYNWTNREIKELLIAESQAMRAENEVLEGFDRAVAA